jgi:hypothetical protein
MAAPTGVLYFYLMATTSHQPTTDGATLHPSRWACIQGLVNVPAVGS